MTALVDVLEAAKIEEIAKELRGAGYEVVQDFQEGAERYDLVAKKAERKIVVEVKARAVLRDATPEIRRHRELARQAGYDEYRLIVVNPPRERTIVVTGLERALHTYLARHAAEKLAVLSAHTLLERVSVTDIDAIEVAPESVHIVGVGTIEVILEYVGGEVTGSMSMEAELPFRFDVVLDAQLAITAVHTLNIDTTDFHE